MDEMDIAMEGFRVEPKEYQDFSLRRVEPYELRADWERIEPWIEQIVELYDGRDDIMTIIKGLAAGDYDLWLVENEDCDIAAVVHTTINTYNSGQRALFLSLIHISEPTRPY